MPSVLTKIMLPLALLEDFPTQQLQILHPIAPQMQQPTIIQQTRQQITRLRRAIMSLRLSILTLTILVFKILRSFIWDESSKS